MAANNMTAGDLKNVNALLDDATIDCVCDLRAAQARLKEIDAQIAKLEQERGAAILDLHKAQERASTVLDIPYTDDNCSTY